MEKQINHTRSIDRKSGRLDIGIDLSEHLGLSPSGEFLLVANYKEQTIKMLPKTDPLIKNLFDSADNWDDDKEDLDKIFSSISDVAIKNGCLIFPKDMASIISSDKSNKVIFHKNGNAIIFGPAKKMQNTEEPSPSLP